jgi:hypothetical protein
MFDAVHQFTMNNKRFSNSSMELSDLFNIYRLQENNWILNSNNAGGVSHTQQYYDIKRTHRFSVNMFHIVNNYNTALNT